MLLFPGYRFVHLTNMAGKSLAPSALFVHVDISDKWGGGAAWYQPRAFGGNVKRSTNSIHLQQGCIVFLHAIGFVYFNIISFSCLTSFILLFLSFLYMNCIKRHSIDKVLTILSFFIFCKLLSFYFSAVNIYSILISERAERAFDYVWQIMAIDSFKQWQEAHSLAVDVLVSYSL